MTVINDVEVTDKKSLKKAMNYLREPYNDGYMWHSGSCLCIQSRNDRMEHWEEIRDSPLEVSYVGVRKGKAYIEVREPEE